MNYSLSMKTLAMCALLGMVAPTINAKPPAQPIPNSGSGSGSGAKPNNPGGNSGRSPVVVVKPGYKPSNKSPSKTVYKKSNLPETAAFAIIAGITYAIVDNAYYRQDQDTYTYEASPPVENQNISNSSQMSKGDIVEFVPSNATTVTVNGATFYVIGKSWYAPISGTNQFVVVDPQL
ncbi:DUF6515 family protein [Vibrio hippocampi]|uniref:DUF1236 domain-containing protein n=1 Tax=Vibrio hippocampi TaxID=654686 RepID=A0ABM8ZLJ8_9VIBR|nr:DUF6515 family protein [Vibrio hippocampi]CAH0529277.1 hypothetical protein VHP8226_03139 [Vibrio hippocampi]